MKTLWQIFAIARNEFRFGLRRGAPVVVTALIGLTVAAAILLEPIANLENSTQYEEYSPEQVAWLTDMGITREIFLSLERDTLADMTASSTNSAWFLMMLLSLLLLPIATAGAIPADRQFGVMELLRSTPVKATTYLAGKFLGVFGIVFFIAAFPFLLFLIILEGVLLSVYQAGIPWYLLGFFLKLTLLDGIPILASGALIGVLTGAAFRSRRGAILPGLLGGIAGAFAWIKLYHPAGIFSTDADTAAAYVFQGYQSIMQTSWAKYYPDLPPFDLSFLGANAPVITFGQVLLMYAAILVFLIAFATLARLWLHRKENF